MAKALAAANSSRDDVLAKYNKLCQLHDQVTGRPGGSAMATAVVGSSKGGHGGSGSGLLMGAQGNHMPSTPMAGQNGAAMAVRMLACSASSDVRSSVLPSCPVCRCLAGMALAQESGPAVPTVVLCPTEMGHTGR